MKQNVRAISLILAILTLCLCLFSCAEEAKKTTSETHENTVETAFTEEAKAIEKTGLWKDALHVEETSLGTGKTEFRFTVTADGKSLNLEVSTDKENLADALLELGLLEGEDGPYGLYVKKVNGILADYDVDQSWWGLNVNGETSMSGASGVTVESGAQYEFIYSK